MATGGKPPTEEELKRMLESSRYEDKVLGALHVLGIEPKLDTPESVVNLMKAFTEVKEDPDRGGSRKESAKNSYHYPKFSVFFGEDGKNDVSWASFKYEVESQLVEKNFTEEQILQGIRRSLKGSAYDKLRILGIGAKVADVMDKLESAYGTVESKQSVMRKFYECKQKPDERIETFAARLEDLFDKAVKMGAVKRSDTEVLKEGLHAGLNTELRHLTIYQKDRYRSYDDFKREVRKIEADTKAEDTSEPKKTCKAAVQPEKDKSELSEMMQLLRKMNERIDKIEKEKDQQQQQPYFYYPRGQSFRGTYRGGGRGRGYTAPPPRGRGEYRPSRPLGRRTFEPTCYNCNQKGHLQRNCPSANQSVCYNCQEPGHFSRECPNK